MSVNSNPTASQENIKKLPISIFWHLFLVSSTPVINLYVRKSRARLPLSIYRKKFKLCTIHTALRAFVMHFRNYVLNAN